MDAIKFHCKTKIHYHINGTDNYLDHIKTSFDMNYCIFITFSYPLNLK